MSGRLDDERALIRAWQRGDLDAANKIATHYDHDIIRMASRRTREQDARDLAQDAWRRVCQGIAAFRLDCGFRTWLFRIVRNAAISRLNDAGGLVDVPRRARPAYLGALAVLRLREAYSGPYTADVWKERPPWTMRAVMGQERPARGRRYLCTALSLHDHKAEPSDAVQSLFSDDDITLDREEYFLPEKVAGMSRNPEQILYAVEQAAEVRMRIHQLPPAQGDSFIARYWTGLTIEQIAKIHGVPKPTVYDRLREARASLRRRLPERPGLPFNVINLQSHISRRAKSKEVGARPIRPRKAEGGFHV
jgi:RNA polymerase sigma factor (sigma-70 family)